MDVSRRSAHLSGPAVEQVQSLDWETPEQLAAALTVAPRRARWEVRLGEAVARHFVARPAANARRLSDLRAIAAMRFEDLYGEPAAAWHIEADWRASEPFLCCAVPVALMQALRDAAAASGAGAPVIESALCADWNQQASRLQTEGDWIVHAGRDATVMVAGDGRHVQALGQVAWSRSEDDAALWRAAERLSLSWRRSAPSGLVVLGDGVHALKRFERPGVGA